MGNLFSSNTKEISNFMSVILILTIKIQLWTSVIVKLKKKKLLPVNLELRLLSDLFFVQSL